MLFSIDNLERADSRVLESLKACLTVVLCLCMARLWQYIRLMLMRTWSLILFGRTQSFGGGVLDQSSEAWNSFVIINFINIHTVTETDSKENYHSTQHNIALYSLQCPVTRCTPLSTNQSLQSGWKWILVTADVQSCRQEENSICSLRPDTIPKRDEDESSPVPFLKQCFLPPHILCHWLALQEIP